MSNRKNAYTEVYTILKDLNEEEYNKIPLEIIEAIRNKRSVAVQLVDKNNALCFGQLRYCMYANFILKKIYKLIE